MVSHLNRNKAPFELDKYPPNPKLPKKNECIMLLYHLFNALEINREMRY